MILHVFDSQTAFVKTGISCFESVTQDNEYWIFGDKAISDHSIAVGRIRSIGLPGRAVSKLLHEQISQFSLVIFHGILNENIWLLKILRRRKYNIKIAWIIYGAEFTLGHLKPAIFLLPQTRVVYYRIAPYRLLFFPHRLIKRILGSDISVLMKSVDFAMHFMPEEVEFANKLFKCQFDMHWFSYVTIEKFIGNSLMNARVKTEGDILIGNSASYTSNHADIFRVLSGIHTTQLKNIVVPLGYGSKKYARYVNDLGKKLFGKRFIPLNSYLPREAYDEIMLSCSVVIMNHCRQQALGNIIVALWIGARVFLSKNVSTYIFLKRMGIHVFSIEDDFLGTSEPDLSSLSNTLIEENRKVIRELFNEKDYHKKVKNSLDKINKL